VLDILAYEPHTARHIATRLIQRFVADTAPPDLVDRVANEFLRTGGDIRETLRAIFTSPEFFSQAAYRSKVKSPFRLVVSALRAVDASPDTSTRTAQIIARLGEPLYLHQAPNGYPLTGESWINTGSILNRINFGLAVAGGRVPGVSLAAWPAGAALENAPREEQVNGAIALLLGDEASPDTRRVLENGVNPLLAIAPPTDSARTALADSLEALDQVEASLAPSGGPPRATERSGRAGGGGGMPSRGGGGGARKTGVDPRYDPLARPSDLEGFAQIVGLALGAPEFQRH
jgi:hypothetical protein